MDLYQSDFSETEPASAGYADILAKMEKVEKKLCKMQKKRKGGKNEHKKKLKKRLAMLEMELKRFVMQQNPRQVWWQTALGNAFPKIVDLASLVLQHRSRRI